MISRRKAVLAMMGVGVGGMALSTGNITVTRPGTAFGTTVRLTVSAATEDQANAALDAGYAEIRKVHKAASLFNTASDLSKFNATGAITNPSAEFQELVKLADYLWRDTDGAFDASVQPLWRAWQVALQQNRQPDLKEINAATALVGWHGLKDHGQLRLSKSSSALTFNGIAQGYAADLVMQAFNTHGVAGSADTGELALNSNDPRRLTIRHPRIASDILGTIEVHSGFVATSGDYATSFTPDFKHHHIFNPVTGLSPSDIAAVTVVAPTGAIADGLATAFMVMGVDRTMAYLAQRQNVSAVLVAKSGDVRASNSLNYQT
jgi:FAD:protein FMN transferase